MKVLDSLSIADTPLLSPTGGEASTTRRSRMIEYLKFIAIVFIPFAIVSTPLFLIVARQLDRETHIKRSKVLDQYPYNRSTKIVTVLLAVFVLPAFVMLGYHLLF